MARMSSTSAFKNAAVAACMSDLLHQMRNYRLKHACKPGRLFVVEPAVGERFRKLALDAAQPACCLRRPGDLRRPVFRLLVYELLASLRSEHRQPLWAWNEQFCDPVEHFLSLLCSLYLNISLVFSLALGFCLVVAVPGVLVAPL